MRQYSYSLIGEYITRIVCLAVIGQNITRHALTVTCIVIYVTRLVSSLMTQPMDYFNFGRLIPYASLTLQYRNA